MKLLEDLKNIHPKDPGGWPWPVKISALLLIFVAILIAGAIFDWQGQWGLLLCERSMPEPELSGVEVCRRHLQTRWNRLPG